MGQCPNPAVNRGVTFSVFLFCIFCSLVLINGDDSPQGMKCSGYCTKDTLKCQLRGGKVVGICSKNSMCCDPLVSASGSCGDKKSDQKVVFFRSPSFPSYTGGDLVCDFKVRIRNETEGIRIDFLLAEMDGLPFIGGADNNVAMCESDMIFIRGFNTWSPPPRCGNLTGYGVLIDINTRQTRNIGMLSIVAVMSSPKYRFNIRISQIISKHNTEIKPDPGKDKDAVAKRSIHLPTVRPSLRISPTKILIKTVRPEQLSSLTHYGNEHDYFHDRSVFADIHKETFKIFDSLYPTANLKSPSIVNGEDTVISTVPWQVSLRLKPEAFRPPQLSEYLNVHHSTESSLESSSDTASSTSASEEDVTMESYPFPNCSEAEGTHFCGGSILDQRHVLSAAHCFFGSSKLDGMLNISSIMVVVGDSNKCKDDNYEDEEGIFPKPDGILKTYRYDIESVVFHYGYDASLLINDVAILRLNESIKYFKHIKPIKLAKSGDNFEGQEALLSGWGDRFTEGNTNNYSSEEPMGPSILQSSRLLEIQNRSFCNERDLSQFGAPPELILTHPKYTYVFDATICTLTRNGSKVEVNTGRGDSGGPLVSYYKKKGNGKESKAKSKNESEPILVGIVSYSIPFDDKDGLMMDGVNRTVDFYTSVAFYRGWIDLALKSFEQIIKNIA